MKLLYDGGGNFVLDREHIGEIAIVMFCPKMGSVRASINWALMRMRLPARCTLPRGMGDAELPRDLPEVARRGILKLHHACPTDHLEFAQFRKIGQDLVLHAVDEKGIGLVIAQISNGRTAMLLSGMWPGGELFAAHARNSRSL